MRLVLSSLCVGLGLSAGLLGSHFQRSPGSNIAGSGVQPGSSTGSVVYAGKFDTVDGCEMKCDADALCQSYTWHDSHPYGSQTYANMCYLRHDAVWHVVVYPLPGHFSGRKCAVLGAHYEASWCSVTQHPTPQWFNRAKFGIYAHWGPYSVPAFGTEWYSRNMYMNGSATNNHHAAKWGPGFGYKDFVPLFTAPKFNATQWAALYRRAGARYAGPVAEHADGFAMYDSKLSNWTSAKMGPRRDVTGEMEAAVRGEGLKFVTTLHHQWLWGWYPTWQPQTDCGEPQYELTESQGGLYGPKTAGAQSFSPPFNTTQRFQQYWRDKALEVATLYQPDLIYFDSRLAALIDDANRLDFLAGYYNKADDWQRRGESTGVVVTYKDLDLEVGAGTLDYERGGVAEINQSPWQTDDSMDRGSWSWVEPPHLKNATELLGELVDIVSKNGCFLLDIPPHADGSIDAAVQATLTQMGDWLAVNGEAIYSTRPWTWFSEGPTRVTPGAFHEWPIFTAKDFRFTQAGSALYAVAMAWQPGGQYVIATLNASAPAARRVTDVALLQQGGGAAVKWSLEADGLHIGPVARPSSLQYGPLAFRLHLDGSKMGVLLWEVHRGFDASPGGVTELHWRSGGDHSARVVIEVRSARGAARGMEAWTRVAAAPNSGRYAWHTPPGGLNRTQLLVRIRADDDERVHDIMELGPML
eukprot:g4147.t1